MAISFSNLHSEDGLKTLDEFLSRRTYISGDEISRDDIKVYGAVPVKPGSGFPNARRWYESISSVLAVRFPGEAVGVKIDGQPASPAPPSTKETKKDVEDADDEDDLDLFGDETEEEKKAAAEREASKASLQDVEDADDEDDLDLFGDETEEEKKAAAERETSKASSKKKESGKSSILLDVKPWDDETDMKKLEAAVRSIEIPGLLWGASQLVPVGYGIKKLQIMMTIVDDLVSVDNLIEDYLTAEPCNEHVQSCDIVAFNKI